jgi:hypothetical protein
MIYTLLGALCYGEKSHEPVVTGFNAVMMTLKLVSPCDLIPIDGVESRIATTIQEQCDKTYRGLFLSNLEKICPRQKNIFKRNKRNKREPISIGIVIVALIASAGVGIGAWGVTRTYEIETKEEELKKTLDDLEKQVFSGEKKLEFLQDEVRKVTSILDQLVADFTLYREKVVELQYLIAYLTGKLMEGRKALHETEKAWKKGELNSDLFDFLNFTLPCGDECPLEHGIFHSCNVKDNKEEIFLDFSVPVINKKLTRIEAEPFVLMMKKNNSTCSLRYVGPKVATISVVEDCVYKTHMETPKERVGFALTQSCSNSTLRDQEKMYQTEKCRPSREGDEKDFLQVKIFDGKYHIYCPYSKYVIGKRVIDCPQRVFTLPLSLTFTLNEVEYKGNLLKVVYRETADPILTEHINWHLNPRLDWSNFTDQFESDLQKNNRKVEEEVKKLSVFEFKTQKDWTVPEIALIVIGTISALLVMVYVARKYIALRIQRRRIPEPKDETEMDPINPAKTHHIIIEG